MALAATSSGRVVPITSGDYDLTDEQIDQLLVRATERRLEQEKQEPLAKASRTPKWTFPKLDAGQLDKAYTSTKGGLAIVDGSRLLEDKHRQAGQGFRKVEDPVTAKTAALEKKKATAGPGWFNLPKTDLTPELKRDLQLMKMRNILDPHRHYKKDGGKMQAPEYSQVGTIVEGPTEFFTGRIENKKRKRTFVEEVLAGEQETGRFKKKYGELQSKKTSGKKAFYKALNEKRKFGVKKGGRG